MGRGIVLTCIICIVGISLSCSRKDSNKLAQNYFAYIELDSTAILISEVTDSLDVPWDIEEGPDNWIWYTEQKGSINRVHTISGEKQLMHEIEDVFYRKSTGLTSLVLHPDFEETPHLFVHYVYANKDETLKDIISSRVVRFTLKNNRLTDRKIIIDSIPGNTFHNGSRMLITEDLKLFIGTGDAGITEETQNAATLNGKVLRLNLDGSIPPDNMNSNSPVWSVGHRNIQGITSINGEVFVSEHGPINDDEINLIEKGGNYGWPDVHGFCDLESEKEYCATHAIVEPLHAWTPTLGTAGLASYTHKQIPEWENALLLVTLKGRSLRLLRLNSENGIAEEKIFLQMIFGRMRDIEVGEDGVVYISSSNMDWHQLHQPWMYDSLPKERGDKIYRLEGVSKQILNKLDKKEELLALKEEAEAFELPDENWQRNATDDDLLVGQKLYLQHCAACHRPDGTGNIGQIPPMTNSDWVSGDKNRLIDIMLMGLNMPIEVDGVLYEGEMPAYRILSDEEIADILNYVRVEFGNAQGNIIAADVLHQRIGL